MTEAKVQFSQSDILEAALFNSENLMEAFQKSSGLFPVEAFERFRYISAKQADLLLRNTKEENNQKSSHDSFLLSTWRFHDSVTQNIANACFGKDDRVAFLGAPSLLRYAGCGRHTLPHLFIDLQSDGLETSNVIGLTHDINLLNGSEFANIFDVVVFDPPWYVATYKRWFSVAAKMVKSYGKVCFPLFQELTRPTALQDREEIIEFCRMYGFDMSIVENSILYDSPSFERAMLRRAGLPVVPWKRADLVVASNWENGKNLEDPPKFGESSLIRRVTVGRVSFDIKFDRNQSFTKSLLSWPQSGFWMSTPSRRDEGNTVCNVYTSNGARFIASRPFDLYSILKEVEGAQDFERWGNNLGIPKEVFIDVV